MIVARSSGYEFCDPVGTKSLHSISHTAVARNVAEVYEQIAQTARDCGRDPAAVRLIAVSKTHPADAVRAAAAAGCRDFGESYLPEALGKIEALADAKLTWHFIGALQSNKTQRVAQHFDWVHTVSRERIARRLSAQCPPGKRLDVCLQVNIDRDPAKQGATPDEVPALLAAVGALPNLRARGLMAILQRSSQPLESYRALGELFRALAPSAPASARWDTLSMGMSGDFREAIRAGATHVRIGTRLFGDRPETAGPDR